MGRGNGQPDKLQLDDIERFSIDTDFTADADALRVRAQADLLKELAGIISVPTFSVWQEPDDDWVDEVKMPIFVDKNGLIAQAIKTGEPEKEFREFLLAVGKYLFESEGERANDFVRSHLSAFGLYEAVTPWAVAKNSYANHHLVESLGSSEMLCGVILSYPERLAYRGNFNSTSRLCMRCLGELQKLPEFDARRLAIEETKWEVSGETIQLHDTLDDILAKATLTQLQHNLSEDIPLAKLEATDLISKAQSRFTRIAFEKHVAQTDAKRFSDLFETTQAEAGHTPDEIRPLLAYLSKSIREYYGENPKMPSADELWKAIEDDLEDWGSPLTRGFIITTYILSFFPEVEEDLKAYTTYSPFNNQIRKMSGFSEIPDPVPF